MRTVAVRRMVRGSATARQRAGGGGGGGGGGKPPVPWTWAGYQRRNLPRGAAKFDAFLEKLKATGGSSIEGMGHDAIHRINLARQDALYSKCTRTWMVYLTILFGFTIGATWAVPLPTKEQVRQ
ncbi:hypothetical protein ACP4OV_011887 [Aristida adscensionis]